MHTKQKRSASCVARQGFCGWQGFFERGTVLRAVAVYCLTGDDPNAPHLSCFRELLEVFWAQAGARRKHQQALRVRCCCVAGRGRCSAVQGDHTMWVGGERGTGLGSTSNARRQLLLADQRTFPPSARTPASPPMLLAPAAIPRMMCLELVVASAAAAAAAVSALVLGRAWCIADLSLCCCPLPAARCNSAELCRRR